MKTKLIYAPIKSDYGANLLRARGIEDINQFMAPDASALQDWRDLDNILDGTCLIANLKEDAKIAIVVD